MISSLAIAVEPRSIVGEESPVESRSSAYLALLDVLFVSLAGTRRSTSGSWTTNTPSDEFLSVSLSDKIITNHTAKRSTTPSESDRATVPTTTVRS